MRFKKKMGLFAMLMCMVLVASGCSSGTAGNGEQTLDIDYVGEDGEVVTETVSQENGGMTGWLKEKLSTDDQDTDNASDSGRDTAENAGEASGLQDLYAQGSSQGGSSSAGGSVSGKSGNDGSSSSGSNGDEATSGNNGDRDSASGGNGGSSGNNGGSSSSGGNSGGGGSSSGGNSGNDGSPSGGNGGNDGSSSGGNDGSGGGSQGSGTSKNTATLTIRCDTAVANGMHEEVRWAGIVPANGCILPVTTLEFTDGETVFDLLCRVRDTYKLQMEYSGTDATAYIQGINNLYEKDAGKWSGWMYHVNGWYPNYGCGQYVVENGDVIEWHYTCDGGADLGNAMVP